MDWFFTHDDGDYDDYKVKDGHETDPSTGSDSDSATEYPSWERPQFLTGMARDLKRRLPYYLDDWKISSLSSAMTILHASLSSFLCQLLPALVFAGWLQETTNGQLAAIEVLMATGIVGSFYAIASGQPLTLVGVSGPVALLVGACYSLNSSYFHADFFAYFWWMCIWASILHALTAIFGLINLVAWITPFTAQVFELFVAISFLYKSIHDMIHPFVLTDADDSNDKDHTMAYSSLVFGVLTFVICWKLHFAESWIYFTRPARTFLASYNMVIAVLVATGVSYIPDFSQSGQDRQDIIQRLDLFSTTRYNWAPSVNRNWLEITPLSGIDTRGIFGALIGGFMLYVLCFMEHNMCSAILQAPKNKLKRPSGYHWDFFVLGLSHIACGFLGLPPCHGVLPQSSRHIRALSKKRTDALGNEFVVRCTEQRWSALLQAGFLFAALAFSNYYFTKMPMGCLFGILLYLGVDSLRSNPVWTRITLKFVQPSERPQIAIVTKVSSYDTVMRYTAIQVGLSAIAFGTVYFTNHGYLFPLILACGVLIRKLILGCIFRERDLQYLDPSDRSEEDIVKEDLEMKHALQSPISATGSDTFQRVHEFHHSNLAYDTDGDDSTKQQPQERQRDAPEEPLSPRVASPRRLPSSHRVTVSSSKPAIKPSWLQVDEESGIAPSPTKRRMVQSLSKVAARESPKAATASGGPTTFLSSWHAWTHMFDSEAVATPGEWCGTGTTAVDDFIKPKSTAQDRDELSIRKTKSSRSTKTEVYDADDTIRSIRSYHRARRQAQVHKTPSGEDTRASNRNRTMRVTTTTPSASELFDSDVMSLKSNRTRTGDMLEQRDRSKPKVRGLSGILGGEEHHPKPISPKSQRSSSSWRSDRSIRKYSDVERVRSNEQLDFDADRVVVLDGILKNSSRGGPNNTGGSSSRIAFAPNAQTLGLQRQHSEQEEM